RRTFPSSSARPVDDGGKGAGREGGSAASVRFETPAVGRGGRRAEAHEGHRFDRRGPGQHPGYGADGDFGGAVLGEAIGAGADGRKGDRPQVVLDGKAESVEIAALQKLVLAGGAAAP